MQKIIDNFENHIIVCGYGKNGSQVAKKLAAYDKKFVIIEKNQDIIDKNNTDKISKNLLFDLAIKLGSDVPACLKSRDLLLNGYGEKITHTKIPENYYFLLINPYLHLSTKEVFNE